MTPTERTPELTREQRIALFRTIYASRRIDDREIAGKRQNKVFFQINGVGHEAIGAAAAMALKSGHDWFFLYYRDRALCYGLGVTAYDMFLGSVGSKLDPATGGRQMPTHWSSAKHRIWSTSSPTGSQFLQAVGCAEAVLRAEQGGLTDLQTYADEVALATTGDGTVSQGEFWEGLNNAVNLKLPVIFLVEDNGYAISTPTEVQYAGANVAALVKGWEPHGLLVLDEVDGCDPIASYHAMAQAAAHCRARRGPALVRAKTIRPYSHSLSDDEALYKTPTQRAEEQKRDPVTTYGARLIELGDLTENELEQLKAEIQMEVDVAWEQAENAPPPDPGTYYDYLYSEEVDPTSKAFDTEATAPDPAGPQKTMIDLINITLKQEMAKNPRILVFGEDVADATREEILTEVKGKGGVFKATHGLQKAFGSHRVYNSPLAEATIIGRALGLAARGFKPVVEIQFFDYIWPAMQQLRDELANFRWRSNNDYKAPMVVRVPIGGYLMGGAVYHSQSGESIFTHIPGLRVVYPSNALDAAGLLRTSIRCDDPVLFLEPKHLYRQTHNKGAEPNDEFMIPFGRARMVREGHHLSLITYGSTVHRAVQAARLAEQEGISVEIVDLRTLSPYDWEAICRTVKKTHRVIVAHEDGKSWGYGAEIAARIADELFFDLDAPVRRIGAKDTWIAYHPTQEDEILPQSSDFLAAYLELIAV
ncbi:MAG: dehydrogenase [Firmicutes bacterium]|nr:dehydrogenase [Bacillota bacterium]